MHLSKHLNIFHFFEKLLMTRYWIPKKEKGISKKDLRVWFEVMCPRKEPSTFKNTYHFVKAFFQIVTFLTRL